MEDNNEEFFTYLDTISIDCMYKINTKGSLDDYILSRYKNNKYSHIHLPIIFPLLNISTIEKIILLMAERNIDPLVIYIFTITYNEITNNDIEVLRLFAKNVTDRDFILAVVNEDYKEYGKYRCDKHIIIYIILASAYEVGEKRLKEVINYFSGSDIDILDLYTTECMDQCEEIYFDIIDNIIDIMELDLRKINLKNEEAMNYIDGLREEDV